MKKIVAICLALLAASAGAVKIEWAQDVMQTTQTKVIVAYHGEDLRFWISPKKNGSDLSISGSTAQTWWQTKAMGDSWVKTNAVITTRTESGTTKFRFEIKWSGGSEGNADEVCFFVRWADGGDNPGQIDNPGVGDISYHINFIVKFLGSPGKNPTVVPLPRRTLDFATTQVLNPPYVTASDLSGVVWWEELYTWWDEEKNEILEEAAETAYQTVAEAANTNWLCTVAAANEKLAEAKSYTQELTSERAKLVTDGNCKKFEFLDSPIGLDYGLLVLDSWLEVDNWKIREIYSNKTLDQHISELAYPAADGSQLAASVATIAAHLNAEDARFVVTNYDSATRTPEAYIEIRVSNDWLRVWSEARRWNALKTWQTNVTVQLGNKAERAWGIYDSETGGYSPDGYTQISSSNILIASGMAYQRTVTPFNSLWVLQCNQGTAQLGGDTNGYFRIKDGDGNTQFEIVKGNRIELGADASGITVNSVISTSLITIPYSVVANEHPTLQVCTDLSAGNWKAEGEAGCPATVSWTGTSGAYVAHVTAPNNLSQMFFKATYLGGSDTIINNNAPVKMQYIYIGNSKYAIGYATINGTGVMTLTPAN